MRWTNQLRQLGSSTVSLLVAEIQELVADLESSGRSTVRLGITIGILSGLAFWTLGSLMVTVVAVLTIWLPIWQASGVVTLVLALASVVTLLVVRSRWRSIESPADTVRRRVDDHLAFWSSLTAEDAAEDPDDRRDGRRVGYGEGRGDRTSADRAGEQW